MLSTKLRQFILTLTAVGGLCSVALAGVSQELIDATNASIDTLRKRDCNLTLKIDGQAVSEKDVTVRQIRSHFGFGAATPKWTFTRSTVDTTAYNKAFQTYFEWATPENEMKWKYTDEQEDLQNYDDADWLINWGARNDIKMRGHSLFWNEYDAWIPNWSKDLDTAGFRAAMERRITQAMTHFKGKVDHWDIINEIVHGPNNAVVVPGMLAALSGKADVFSWIFKTARAIDPDVKMGVNEYNVVEAVSAAKEYITEIKKIESEGGKIDFVGLEGHFGDYLESADYMERIDTVANALPGKEIWLTEVDFELDTLVRADKVEELMRRLFAHPRIGGIMLWIWWEGNRWRPTYTSFLVDSNFTENELGARWRMVRDEWKTAKTGTTSASGAYAFKGFHGKYVVSVQKDADYAYIDTIYLEPGAGPKAIEINFSKTIGVRESRKSAGPATFRFNGRSLPIFSVGNTQVYLSTYILSGKLVSTVPVILADGCALRTDIAAGCHIFRLHAAGRVLYTGKVLAGR